MSFRLPLIAMSTERVLGGLVAIALAGAFAGCSSSGVKVQGSATTAVAVPSTLAASGPTPAVAVNAGLAFGGGHILVDGHGVTLYKDSQEVNGHIACTGSCAQTWPPYLVPAGGSVVAGPGVSGTVSMVTRPDGSRQVTFNGSPLYHYLGDRGPGTAAGNGIGGTWSVVPASGLSPLAPGAPPEPAINTPGAGASSGPAATSPPLRPPAATSTPTTLPLATSPPTTSSPPPTTSPPTTSPSPPPTTAGWA